ncbi:MAG: patatin-like phospholipase family protein [Deltaproteobacteria bacterium]|nr:patatin-like phospholipase family protein [Deltaproteobacteria bacterium]
MAQRLSFRLSIILTISLFVGTIQANAAKFQPPSLQKRLTMRANKKGKKVLLLSFAGGGLMGALSLDMLVRLDKSLKTKLGAKFELRDHVAAVAGNSTGSLIAAGLAANISLEKIRAAYHQGDTIFPAPKSTMVQSVRSFFRAKYDNTGLKKVLGKYFDPKLKLNDLSIPIVIPSVEMTTSMDNAQERGGTNGTAYQTVAKRRNSGDLNLVETLLSSSAAPTFLPMVPNPRRKVDAQGNKLYNSDGLVVANDPSMELWAHVKQAAREAKVTIHGEQDLTMLTFGTGRNPVTSGKPMKPNRGKLGWITGKNTIIETFMSAQADATHRQLKLALDKSYKRLDTWLPRADMQIDDPKVVGELERFVAKNKPLQKQIDKTAEWLIGELQLTRIPEGSSTKVPDAAKFL